MLKFTRKKVVSNRAATSDMTREHFRGRYQCYSENTDVLRALVAYQLPKKTDLAVRVHVWNCERCRSEYLKLKAELVREAASQALGLTSKYPVVENTQSNIGMEPQTTTQEDADFRELLKQLLSEEQLRDKLLFNPVFQHRLKLICQSITRNATDADVLANYVRAVVCDRLDQFEPDYNRPYGNFFNWVKRIARNKFIDENRRKSVRKEEGQLDETYMVEDVAVDVEAEAERREAIERFWGFVSRLDKVTQKIMHCHLRDYSLKEIQAKLATEEIQLSHVAIGNLVRKVMADFLASEDGHIATLIARKGKYLSRDRERDDLSARKSGS